MALRLIRLKQFLAILQPDAIGYEDVKFVGQSMPPGQKQNLTALVARAVSGAQVVHALAATLVTWAEERNIPCEGIGIGVIKKYATGAGNANKEAVIAACDDEFGTDFSNEDYEKTGADNIADSMFICSMMVQNYSEGL